MTMAMAMVAAMVITIIIRRSGVMARIMTRILYIEI